VAGMLWLDMTLIQQVFEEWLMLGLDRELLEQTFGLWLELWD